MGEVRRRTFARQAPRTSSSQCRTLESTSSSEPATIDCSLRVSAARCTRISSRCALSRSGSGRDGREPGLGRVGITPGRHLADLIVEPDHAAQRPLALPAPVFPSLVDLDAFCDRNPNAAYRSFDVGP
jgi:hypothetical protein